MVDCLSCATLIRVSISSLLSLIDAQIGTLKQARALLSTPDTPAKPKLGRPRGSTNAPAKRKKGTSAQRDVRGSQQRLRHAGRDRRKQRSSLGEMMDSTTIDRNTRGLDTPDERDNVLVGWTATNTEENSTAETSMT